MTEISKTPLLDTIREPADLRRLAPSDLRPLADELRAEMIDAVSITGGQDAVKGKILRVAHLGYFGAFDILTSVTALEMTLADLGVPVTRGAGTAAAESILESGPVAK